MSNTIIYFLKVNAVYSVLFLFYRTVLHRHTLFGTNRTLLWLFIPISFLIPYVTIPVHHTTLITEQLWISNINFTEVFTASEVGEPSKPEVNLLRIIVTAAYFSVMLILSLRFVRQLIQLRQVTGKARKHTGNLYFTDHKNAPFSFSGKVFVPYNFAETQGNRIILEHEQYHVRNRHTLELIVAEIFSIIFWFNPFVILFKYTLRDIHEFQADKYASNFTDSVNDYLLLMASGLNLQRSIFHSFHSSTIKKRIHMISNTSNKRKRSKTVYLLILPVLLLTGALFSNIGNAQIKGVTTPQTITADGAPNGYPIKESAITNTSGFGYRTNPFTKQKQLHKGIDLAAPEGTPVSVKADGTVIKLEENIKGHGNYLVIQHGESFTTFYSHLSGFNVSLNQKVKSGDVIAFVGSTGLSTGPHLHYEIRKNGEAINPEEYLK